jgi:hypothetical protein
MRPEASLVRPEADDDVAGVVGHGDHLGMAARPVLEAKANASDSTLPAPCGGVPGACANHGKCRFAVTIGRG